MKKTQNEDVCFKALLTCTFISGLFKKYLPTEFVAAVQGRYSQKEAKEPSRSYVSHLSS